MGSVMYLASLAHSILRTQGRALHGGNIMGSSMMAVHGGSNGEYERWLESRSKLGVVQHDTNEADADGNINRILLDHWRYGANDMADDEDYKEWLESRKKYGAGGGIVNGGKTNVNVRFGSADDRTNADFQRWLETRNKYGASVSGGDSDFEKWLETQNKYGLKGSDLGDAYQDWLAETGKLGASAPSSDSDFEKWLETQNKYGLKGSHLGDAYQDSLAETKKYGASSPSADSDFQKWLESQNKYGLKGSDLGDAYQDWLAETKKYGSIKDNDGNANDATNRLGSSEGRPQEWSEYQIMNENVKYDANGMYGHSQKSEDRLGALSEKEMPVIANSDSTVSTIDWPLQGIAHSSCTGLNGCTPSNNVTVLIVYGPAYHSSIAEMAWNVAIGVHAALQSHIRHHPNSPTHGHIVYGHTSNITFSDVQDADAIIIGTPVYNGNVHPDVQNVSEISNG
jgi:hypothetical protein